MEPPEEEENQLTAVLKLPVMVQSLISSVPRLSNALLVKTWALCLVEEMVWWPPFSAREVPWGDGDGAPVACYLCNGTVPAQVKYRFSDGLVLPVPNEVIPGNGAGSGCMGHGL